MKAGGKGWCGSPTGKHLAAIGDSLGLSLAARTSSRLQEHHAQPVGLLTPRELVKQGAVWEGRI